MTKNKKIKSAQIIKLLYRYYPNAHCALNHKGPFQLLVATILSAQCTDERVNKVTPILFKIYPNPEKLGSAPISDVENIIKSTGFFKNKAKSIKAASQIIFEKYGNSDFPQTLDELIQLPGVGRKTANVVLGNAFQITSGIVVDTHVSRLAYRLGWTKSRNPVQIEKDLTQLIDQNQWIDISHLLIFHGRQICKARKPKCEHCFLAELCPRLGVIV